MKPEHYICFSTFFSNWGDRMWTFSVGIYLVKLTPGSLQLAAIFGLVVSLSAVIFSPIVGDWIDQSARLWSARILLVLQNCLVIVCAVTLLLYLFNVTQNENVKLFLQALVIVSGSFANVAGQGEKIAVGRDWVVVVSRGNNEVLTKTNAMIRRIDLTVAILAPLSVGLLMSIISDEAGLMLICSWNIISMFGEYFLLLKVYKLVPELAVKWSQVEVIEMLQGNENQKNAADKHFVTNNNSHKNVAHSVSKWNVFKRFQTIILGWKVYKRQSVFLAGCAMAALFLTVIGFGHVTIGYAYLEGLSELYVSIFMAAGSLVGVFGTFMYPKIREKVGLLKTGLIGFIMQWSMLMLCVISIWLPGSPSNLYSGSLSVKSSTANDTIIGNSDSLLVNANATVIESVLVSSQKDLTSIIVLVAGIILSRAGLWISDLTITQLQQENVPEEERGIVGGVQYSFNCLLDILRFSLTIILPHKNQFGILIVISVSAIACSGVIYSIFFARFSKGSSSRQPQSNDDSISRHASISVEKG